MTNRAAKLGVMLLAVAKAALIVATGTIGSWAIVEVNARLSSTVPWFILPIAFVCLVAWRLIEAEDLKVRTYKRGRFWISAAITVSIGLAVASFMLTYFPNVQTKLSLPGDDIQAPGYFRVLASFAVVASAGVIEEYAVRAHIQVPLKETVSPVAGEVLGGMVFVALHLIGPTDINHVLYIALLGFTCGRLVAKTGRISYAALAHTLSNLIVVSAVVLMRYKTG